MNFEELLPYLFFSFIGSVIRFLIGLYSNKNIEPKQINFHEERTVNLKLLKNHQIYTVLIIDIIIGLLVITLIFFSPFRLLLNGLSCGLIGFSVLNFIEIMVNSFYSGLRKANFFKIILEITNQKKIGNRKNLEFQPKDVKQDDVLSVENRLRSDKNKLNK